MSEWTEVTPTEPGFYFLRMRGAKSGVRRTEVVELGVPPKDEWIAKMGVKLAFKNWDKTFRRYHYSEIHIAPWCAPVLWAGPIEPPPIPPGDMQSSWRKTPKEPDA